MLERDGVEYNSALLKPHEGEVELGIFRDAKFVPSSGCIIGVDYRKTALVLSKELASSKTAVSDNEVDDTYDRFSSAIGTTNVEVDDNGVVTRTSTGSGLQATSEGDKSWDSCLPCAMEVEDSSTAGEGDKKMVSLGARTRQSRRLVAVTNFARLGMNRHYP